MGNGSSGPLTIGGLSGQGGGRILPGARGGVGELILNLPRIDVDADVATDQPDHRPAAPFGQPLNTIFTAPGGGAGQAGAGDAFVVYVWGGVQATPTSGGGGGWGAAGGAGSLRDTATVQKSANIGAPGGKAIKTNGHAVTWLGGAGRAYGAVG